MGVTSHQGGQERWPQGKGAQVVMRDTPGRYAKCEAPKGKYLSPSLEGCDHWKAQCGDKSHAAFGEGPTEKGRANGTSPAAYFTRREAGGKGSLRYLAISLPYQGVERDHGQGALRAKQRLYSTCGFK